jgi:NAD(P)-dependent dehydrogenase (short-subunit alcohol dehydrogenase family)/rhamnose utilization protein RhaD (predicted bifunctional aldolase and dehydrogenase)
MNDFPEALDSGLTVADQMAKDDVLALPGLSSLSYKTSLTQPFGFSESVIWISRRGADLARLQREDFSCVRLKPIDEVLTLDQDFPLAALENLLSTNRTFAHSPEPDLSLVLHSVIPESWVLLGQSALIQALASSPEGQKRIESLFDYRVKVVEFQPSMFAVSRLCREAYQRSRDLEAIVVSNFGVLSFGSSPGMAYQFLTGLTGKVWEYIKGQGIRMPDMSHRASTYGHPDSAGIAGVRKELSDSAGIPLLLSTLRFSEDLQVSEHGNLKEVFEKIIPYPHMAAVIKPFFADLTDLPSYAEKYQSYLKLNQAKDTRDYAPRVILNGKTGFFIASETAPGLASAKIWVDHILLVMSAAEELGGYLPPSAEMSYVREHWLVPAARENIRGKIFQGEIALVTGGASGIGKACVEALLERGAAVVSLDINPAVESLFPDRAGYLGLECDLTDEAAVKTAFEKMSEIFGGLDMLVLNAGIFPAGRKIEELDLEHFQQVMSINLDANLNILRLAYPLLKLSPCYGRVVINASKNVLAPGAGAAAYSSSKAALTQLGRVALLEWSKDHIRLNMVHPDAIFDTGIWTEEVLQARAAHYHMTVQEYKTRNLLGVELNSKDVAEMIAEMLGPLFGKITGAQIPIDGGSDRVI